MFTYRVKELKITQTSPYKLVYGKEPKLAMDKIREDTLVERLIEITNKVPQIREDAQSAIRMAQEKLDNHFGKDKHVRFHKGDLVLYYDKAKAMQHHTKLENKWKGPFEIEKVLDKGAYIISKDGKRIRSTVNGNLLKKYHGRSQWEPIIVINTEEK